MASPQNTLKLTQTNPYTTQNQNLDGVFRGALSSILGFFWLRSLEFNKFFNSANDIVNIPKNLI
jgi:hypothetical protein